VEDDDDRAWLRDLPHVDPLLGMRAVGAPHSES
jgi:hypothetical protein